MDLRPEHLGYLVCPVCRSALVLSGNAVECVACKLRYPILDGLPVLIAARATRA